MSQNKVFLMSKCELRQNIKIKTSIKVIVIVILIDQNICKGTVINNNNGGAAE